MGKVGGNRRGFFAGTDHARSPLLDGNKSDSESGTGGSDIIMTLGASAAACPGTGIASKSSKGAICCLKSCGQCGCPGGVPHHCEKNVSKRECQDGVSCLLPQSIHLICCARFFHSMISSTLRGRTR